MGSPAFRSRQFREAWLGIDPIPGSTHMKRFQSNLTSMIMLLVAAVILLGVSTIIAYQNQIELQRLRVEITKRAAPAPASAAPKEPATEARLAALEKRLGLNDPDVDTLKASLSREQAEAKILAEKAAAMTRPARPPVQEDVPSPTALPTEPAPPESAPPAANENSPEARFAAAPAAAVLEKYDPFWYSGQINKGRTQGIQPKQQFALRRPGTSTIIGMVNVTACEEDAAAVELVKGSLSDEKVKPQQGDELVDTKKLVAPVRTP